LKNEHISNNRENKNVENKSVENNKLLKTDNCAKIKAKRTTKNSVFIDLFQDKKNLLKLYRVLHPEDTKSTEEDLEIVTLENVLTDNLYNDLGFVANGKLLILVEAQSTWTENILIRALLYLAQSYKEYFQTTKQDLYKSGKVTMPKPEIYVIYTGDRGNRPDVISLSEEFFGGEELNIEIKAKVIYEEDTLDKGDISGETERHATKEESNIINQYIIFCKVFDDQRRLYGLTEKTVKETIRICKDRNILREYLESREKEVSGHLMSSSGAMNEFSGNLSEMKRRSVTIMGILFSDEEIMELYGYGKMKEADVKTAERLLKKGKMTIEEIAECVPSLTMQELQKIEAEIMNLV
jgi:hypothetical protein